MNPKKFFPHNFLSYLFWNSDVTPLQSALQQARIRKHFLYINLPASLSPRRIQSRTQSLQAFWSAGQRREDSGDIEKIQFF